MQDQKLNWTSARDRCRQFGGDLASIASADDDSGIEQLLPDSNTWFWIGYNDIEKEGSFTWSDGMPSIFQNWGPGENLSDQKEGEDCVATNRQGPHSGYRWSDAPCSWEINFVCKFF